MKNLNRFDVNIVLSENINNFDLRGFNKLTEDEKISVTDKVSSKILKSIKNKFNKAYFSEIEKTKGDITKLNGYVDLKKSILLFEQVAKSNQATISLKKCVVLLKETLYILETNVANFTRGFSKKDDLCIFLYDSMVSAVCEGAVLTLAEYIGFDANGNLIPLKSKKKLEDNNFFKSMDKFIDMNNNRKLQRVFDFKDKLNEEFLNIALITIGVIILVLLVIRTVVFTIYYTRVLISKKLYALSQMLVMNASTLDKKDTKGKQLSYAKKIKELADKFAIENLNSEVKANTDLKQNDNEIQQSSSDDNNIATNSSSPIDVVF